MDDISNSTFSNINHNSTTSGLTVKDLALQHYAYIIALGVHKYWLVIISSLGLIGNIISLKIMTMVSYVFQLVYLKDPRETVVDQPGLFQLSFTLQ